MLYFQTELMVERLSGDSMSLGAIPFFYMICHGMIPGIAGRTSGRMQQKWCAADALSGYFANEPPKSRASAQHVKKCVGDIPETWGTASGGSSSGAAGISGRFTASRWCRTSG